ncbi:tripartite tricarboxylate transporter substrate binding protein [Comamonas sp. NoAH]|uniref:tripartite tricarboxylate transporter substrate binding protein n=1 Tax=Comamonas halotolerans TaxID=3041496 RepID=UPI0024E0A64F|nr:tripartite tricarboxylate transporter substrate binding protein [Comamonas sp. NoAH]
MNPFNASATVSAAQPFSRLLVILITLLRILVAILLVYGVTCASPAIATSSTKPVKLVVGFGAGGAMDIIARAIATQLSEKLQRPVYVENKVGAGGAIAAAYVTKSRTDGNTLLLASPAEIFINQLFNPSLRRNGVDQLVPVARISEMPIVLVTNQESQIQQVTDIRQAAHNNPKGISFASSGIGSSHHLAGEIFKHSLGVELIHVPYSGGASATASLLAQQVDLLFAGIAPIASHIHNEKLRPLAIASGQRSHLLPNVPTLQELGLKGFHPLYWQGLFLPQGTPAELATFWSQVVEDLLQDPALVHKLEDMGFSIAYQERTDFMAFLHAEKRNYQHATKIADLTN